MTFDVVLTVHRL